MLAFLPMGESYRVGQCWECIIYNVSGLTGTTLLLARRLGEGLRDSSHHRHTWNHV